MRRTEYQVKLKVWIRYDGRDCLAWCPAIDVRTQARTKKRALESLREAVELWFESCIDRKVLNDALQEVGFVKYSNNEVLSEDVDAVTVCATETSASNGVEERPSFSVGKGRDTGHIEGVIPAHLAVDQLWQMHRASA